MSPFTGRSRPNVIPSVNGSHSARCTQYEGA
jgi:hypothetical protein